MPRPRAPSASSTNSSLAHQELSSLYDYLFKIILLGPSGAGKSCLLHRYVHNTWRVLSSQTIGVEFSSKIIKIGSGASKKRIKLQLWDTAGTERFRSVSRSYYRGAAGAVLCYDVTSRTSWEEIGTFWGDVRSLAGPGVVGVCCGCKSDLVEGKGGTNGDVPTPMSASVSSRQSGFGFEGGMGRSRGGSIKMNGMRWTATKSSEGREVSVEEANRWASRNGVPVVMEVSAFTGENVDEMFQRLARTILTKIELGEIDPDDPQSGIQYGDTGGWVGDFGTDASTSRRKKGAGKVLLNGMSEWGDVFRTPATRGGRGCC